MSASWKLTLPCTRAEAEAIDMDAGVLASLDPVPVLMTSERIPDDPASWQLEAYFDRKPAKPQIDIIRALVPSAKRSRAVLEQLPDEDWVTMSQTGLEPVLAGRFYIHTSGNMGAVPPGAVPLCIEASRAFGTGQHETTSGCLHMLDTIKQSGWQFRNIIDVGTGTGLLAFAAMHLWPAAHATASDIDPASIDVTAENAAINGVRLGQGPGRLALAVAPGVSHPLIDRRAPYDLVIANILAGPLIALAPAISSVLAEGGMLMLAGLLDSQAGAVITAYRRQGLMLMKQVPRGDWPTLVLRKRPRHGHPRTGRRGNGSSGETPGFGSW